MPQVWRLVSHAQPRKLGPLLVYLGGDLSHVVDVALGVDAARNGEADEFQRRLCPPPPNITLPISTDRTPP